MKKWICAITVIITILTAASCKKNPIPPAGDFTAQEQEAIQASGKWLQLIDEGRYSQSWDEAAGYFKNSISRDRWTAALTATRQPLGKSINRTLHSKEYRTSLPGAPDGMYVVIMYKTSFMNKKESIETITPMKDADGTWRVAGYYIR